MLIKIVLTKCNFIMKLVVANLLFCSLFLLSLSSAREEKSFSFIDCLGQFQNDWAFCDNIPCEPVFFGLTGPCVARIAGCQAGAINRYDRCEQEY